MDWEEILPLRMQDPAEMRLVEKQSTAVHLDGNFTVVIIGNGPKAVVGVAKRSPLDKMNLGIGRRLAAVRAYRKFQQQLKGLGGSPKQGRAA